MTDYTEMDVTGVSAATLRNLITERTAAFPSVELLRRDGRLILRTWRVTFDVAGLRGEDEPPPRGATARGSA